MNGLDTASTRTVTDRIAYPSPTLPSGTARRLNPSHDRAAPRRPRGSDESQFTSAGTSVNGTIESPPPVPSMGGRQEDRP